MVLGADIAGEDLIRAMSSTPAEEYVLVESDGTIFGVLATADVDRAFEEGAREVSDAASGVGTARLVRRTPRAAAARGVGAPRRRARAAGTTSASRRESPSTPTGAGSPTTTSSAARRASR